MFDQDEVKTLMDALDSWESAPQTNGLLGEMIQGMMMGGKEDEQERKARNDVALQKAERERNLRKIRVIRLKAKLLELQEQNLTSDEQASV